MGKMNQTGFWRWLKDNIAEDVEEFTDNMKENLDIIAFMAYMLVPSSLIVIGSLILAVLLSPFFLLLFLLFVPWALGLLYIIWRDEVRVEA
jgi:hypothetical protein